MIDPRFASWRSLLATLALMVAVFAVMHRFQTGTWRWDLDDWVPTALGMILGLLLWRVLVLWIVRRQRTRNRPST